MTKIGGVVRGVPGIGGALAGAADAIARAVTQACVALMGGIEALVGAGLHLLARYVDQTLEQWLSSAAIVGHLAELVGGALYRVSGLKALVHQLSTAMHIVLHRFVQIGRELVHVRTLIRTLEHDITKGIGEDVLPRIRSLDRRLHHLGERVTADFEAAEAQAAAATADLWSWLANIGSRPLDRTFADVVAVALGALGLSGLRCSSLLRSLSSRGCGLWSGLEDILGLLFDAVIFTDLCALLPELERLFAELEAPVVSLIASAADAACARPPAGWAELPPPTLHVPQVYYNGTPPGN
jgi:hypothetical protein